MPVSDYTPSVAQVASYIRARTKTEGGEEAGTFNPAVDWTNGSGDGTRPTAEGVEEAISTVIGRIANVIGVDVPVEHQDAAQDYVAIRTAALIELTYWPEQVNTGRSTYPQLVEEANDVRADLYSSLGIATDDTGGGAVPATAGYPSYGGFPTTAIGMEHPW